MSKKASCRIMFVLVALGLLILTLNFQPVSADGLIGDVNDDGIVNLEDLIPVKQAFGSYPGHPRWNAQADVNEDGTVDMKDIHLILEHLGETEVINAVVKICPHTLNLKCKGRWITASFELPEGYDPHDIDVSTIMLNDTIPAELKPVAIADYDCDGIPALIVKFDRQKVIDLIQRNCQIQCKFGIVTLTITGRLKTEKFQGSDTIRIILPKPCRR